MTEPPDVTVSQFFMHLYCQLECNKEKNNMVDASLLLINKKDRFFHIYNESKSHFSICDASLHRY